MSFSVDDLVSSLSSTHVGQEAMDLAVLQAQLAETLFSSGPSNSFMGGSRQIPARGRSQNTQPCNTPLARTPSASSATWGMMDTTERGRTNSVSSAYANDMDEDERMVEELLMPSSSFYGNNYGSSTSSSNSYHNQAPLPSPISSHPQINTMGMGFSSSYNSYPDPSPSSPTSSLFTTTDPFYVAQMQSLNSPAQSQSVFAQNGRLAQNSPFAMPSQYHQHQHGMSMNHTSIPLKSYTAAF